MARKSILASSIASSLNRMRNRTIALHISDSCFSVEELTEAVWGDARLACTQYKAALHPNIRASQDLGRTDEVVCVIPLPTRPTSGLRHLKPDSDGRLISWPKWKEEMAPTGRYKHQRNIRGIALRMSLKQAVPSDYFYGVDRHDKVSGPRYGIILSPSLVGQDLFDTYVKEFTRLNDMLETLEYMVAFGKEVARNCTTPGIANRLWPEAKNFVGLVLAEELKHAKISAWPKGIKRMLSDKSSLPASLSVSSVSSDGMLKQLCVIADTILAAELMPNFTEHWDNDPAGKLERIEAVDICHAELPHDVQELVPTPEPEPEED